MYSKTDMTLQDYFQLAGVGTSVRAARALNQSISGSEPGAFAQLLTGMQQTGAPDVSEMTRGLSVRDYLENRVQVQVRHSDPAAPKPGGLENSATATAGADERTLKQHTGLIDNYTASANGDDLKSQADPATRIDRTIAASIEKAAARHRLPAGLIRSVIQAESNFNPDAISPAGAQGLMQLMPGTAGEMGVKDPFDIDQNIDGGARYLRRMLDRFDGDLKKALAAYNAGPGTVIKYNGHVPYRETRNYVQKVLAYSRQHGGTKVTI